MNLAIIKNHIKNYKWSFILYLVMLVTFGQMMVFMFPSFSDQGESLSQFLDAYPEAMKQAFGLNTNTFSSVDGFLSVEYYASTWVIIIAIFIFSLGGNVVAGEIDKKTSELTFTLPVKRYNIILSKTLASILLIIILNFISFGTNLISIKIIGEDFSMAGNIKFFILSLSMCLFLLSLTTLFSSFLRQKSKVYGLSAGFFIISYMVHIFAGINETAEKFYFLSFFKYYGNPSEVLMGKSFEIAHVLYFILVSIVLFSVSLCIVEKRDL